MTIKNNRPAADGAAIEKTPGDGEGFSPATLAQTPFQLLPPLTGDEYAALKADIQANGVLVPITVDQHGVIIDGHHRQQIAAELSIPCPRVMQDFTTDEKRHDLALALNLKRRHLTRERFRELIAAEAKRTPDASDREIARRLGCDHKTVGAVRRPMSKLVTEMGKFPTQRMTREEAAAVTARSRQLIADGEQLTREEAEALTETIGRALADADRLWIELLEGGMPPSKVAAVVLESWGRFREEFTAMDPDAAEVADSMWEHIEAPRVTAILNWQPGGGS